ncbi:ATP synthase mitochondrial F1 complex assembly factor 2-like [Gordionus sp. m RMFG-2023]|uniref:ATP synthase mitochondrial F1 complex assembly factor 2-like n=1 Tax=Gordionus sp. m RMFG-2023 TaxID=3053472 RepID=UPI0031FD450A
MHFTTMLNMSLDNPQKLSKDALITSLLSFLENDTLCYRNDGEELYMLQSKLWDPLIDWFEKRFNVKVNSTVTLLNPITDSNSKERLTRHLFSHSFEVLTGYKYSCEASRSLIITCALMEGTIDSEKAANLALLEQNFQIQKWGNVEWSHDIHECDVISRLASSYIFCHFNQEISNIQSIS